MTINGLTAEQLAVLFTTRGPNVAWFVGAGASAAAGIPTGYDMILDFKTRLFCSATRLPRREVDPGDPLWRDRITTFLDGTNGLPAADDPSEYAVAFEVVYPDAADRRRYIEAAIQKGTPSFGHRVIGSLIANGRLPAIFTTNFDPLVENSAVVANDLLDAGSRSLPTVSALDNAERAERCVRDSSWPLVVKLHGDYQSDFLKNTTAELAEQDKRLRAVLVEACSRFGLVVAGYSGRDSSIIEALGEAAGRTNAFPGGLFWVLRPETEPLPAVSALMKGAADRGIECHFVVAENFDELAGAIERQADLPEPLARHVRAARPASRLQQVNLPTQAAARFPVLRTSALPLVGVPTMARRLLLAEPSTTRQVQDALRAAGARQVVASAQGREVAAFGSDSDLLLGLASFHPTLDGDIPLDPETDSWALGLLYEALARALSRRLPLRPRLNGRGHQLVLVAPEKSRTDEAATADRQLLAEVRSAYGEDLFGFDRNLGYPYAEAARVRLEHRLARWWCVFDPFTWVDLPPLGDPADPVARSSRQKAVEAAGDWRRERWAQRYNAQWSSIIAAWSKLLAPTRTTEIRAIGPHADPGTDAVFQLWNVTAWSSPAHQLEDVR